MDLEANKRTLSILHIVYGGLYAVLFLFLMVVFEMFLPFMETAVIEEEGEEFAWIIPLLGTGFKTLFVALFLFAALPSIIGGLGTLRGKKWGMILLLVAGCLSIFSFPLGTALGGYTIYVFVEDNKQNNG